MDFLTQLRARLTERINDRAAAKAELDGVLIAPTNEARDLNDAESAAFAEARSKVTAADAEIDTLNARIAELEKIEARKHEIAATVPAGVSARVHSEPRTYSRHAERTEGRSFIGDLIARSAGDFDAAQRLSRHMNEERVERGAVLEARAAGTSAFAGLTVPQYLVELAAPAARAMRPFADICTKWELPAEGMSVNISRGTTGSSAAAQATENAGVSETNMDDTLLTVPVVTIAGQQTISRQGIERGSGIDLFAVRDLVRAYQTTLDNQLLNGAGSSGEHQGVNGLAGTAAVTFTTASPTVALAWPKLFDLIQQVQSGAFTGISHFIMHPRRFWWFASNVGTNFPFVQFAGSGAQSGGNVAGTNYGEGISGILAGIPVVVDGNVTTTASTNQDVIYGVTADECHLWEDPNAPMFIRAEQTNAASLGVTLVVYGYSAFTGGRYPGAHGRISGTGLQTPTF